MSRWASLADTYAEPGSAQAPTGPPPQGGLVNRGDVSLGVIMNYQCSVFGRKAVISDPRCICLGYRWSSAFDEPEFGSFRIRVQSKLPNQKAPSPGTSWWRQAGHLHSKHPNQTRAKSASRAARKRLQSTTAAGFHPEVAGPRRCGS